MSLQQASMKHKHFLNTQDWSRSELDALLTQAYELALPTRELQRHAPVASARAEAASQDADRDSGHDATGRPAGDVLALECDLTG